MTVLRTGSNRKYADGWAAAFSRKTTKKKTVKSKKKTTSKKSK